MGVSFGLVGYNHSLPSVTDEIGSALNKSRVMGMSMAASGDAKEEEWRPKRHRKPSIATHSISLSRRKRCPVGGVLGWTAELHSSAGQQNYIN